jgi:hypothetical protein
LSGGSRKNSPTTLCIRALRTGNGNKISEKGYNKNRFLLSPPEEVLGRTNPHTFLTLFNNAIITLN